MVKRKTCIFNLLYGFPIQFYTSFDSNFQGKRSDISLNLITVDCENYYCMCVRFFFGSSERMWALVMNPNHDPLQSGEFHGEHIVLKL